MEGSRGDRLPAEATQQLVVLRSFFDFGFSRSRKLSICVQTPSLRWLNLIHNSASSPLWSAYGSESPQGRILFRFGGDEPQLADLDKSIRQIVVCLLQFLVFHRELPGKPFMVYSLSHVFGNIRFRSEYQWTPLLSCINIQFEFVRCFGSLCYSIERHFGYWCLSAVAFNPLYQ